MYTIRCINKALGSQHFQGEFETLAAADARCFELSERSQSFMRFETWRGTPESPVEKVTLVPVGTPLNDTLKAMFGQAGKGGAR